MIVNIGKKVPLLCLLFAFFVSRNSEAQNHRLFDEINFFAEQNDSLHKQDFDIKPFLPDFVLDSLPHLPVQNKTLDFLLNKPLVHYTKKDFSLTINPITSILFSFENKDLQTESALGLALQCAAKERFFFSGDFFVKQEVKDEFFLPEDSLLRRTAGVGAYFAEHGNTTFTPVIVGELSFKASESLYFSIGRNKHFFGNGYRSLFLSDNAEPYLYFKTRVDIWKLKYVWLIASLKDMEVIHSDFSPQLFPKAAFIHYLSLQLGRRVHLSFFESVISNPFDARGRRKGYEAAYFNPIIFLRPVEFYAGSHDNSLLGVGGKIRLFQSLFLYAQFILDDIVLAKIAVGKGWWGNKYGLQAGFQWFHAGVKGLFLQGEANLLRPYLYSHGEAYVGRAGISNLNYGHRAQSLAHPGGGNLGELIARIRYNRGRFFAKASVLVQKKGLDKDSLSYGGNLYKSYDLRPGDYGVHFLQGKMRTLLWSELEISYLLNPAYRLALFFRSEYAREISGGVFPRQYRLTGGIHTRIFQKKKNYWRN